MDLTKFSKTELLEKCSELGITKCKSKTKIQLILLINEHDHATNEHITNVINIIFNLLI